MCVEARVCLSTAAKWTRRQTGSFSSAGAVSDEDWSCVCLCCWVAVFWVSAGWFYMQRCLGTKQKNNVDCLVFYPRHTGPLILDQDGCRWMEYCKAHVISVTPQLAYDYLLLQQDWQHYSSRASWLKCMSVCVWWSCVWLSDLRTVCHAWF